MFYENVQASIAGMHVATSGKMPASVDLIATVQEFAPGRIVISSSTTTLLIVLSERYIISLISWGKKENQDSRFQPSSSGQSRRCWTL